MTIGAMGKSVEVLLVEDNPGDVRLTLEVFKESKVRTHLSVVGDGVEAMAFLRREGKYVNAPRKKWGHIPFSKEIMRVKSIFLAFAFSTKFRKCPH
jgi:CheY-like chemotaxis protein